MPSLATTTSISRVRFSALRAWLGLGLGLGLGLVYLAGTLLGTARLERRARLAEQLLHLVRVRVRVNQACRRRYPNPKEARQAQVP